MRILMICLVLARFARAEMSLERDPNSLTRRPVPVAAMAQDNILRLSVKLSDGSLIIGVPEQGVLPFRCSLGDIKLKMAGIRSIQVAKESVIQFRNGDQLRGVFSLKSLPLTTSFGNVNIATEFITGLTVIAQGRQDVGRNLVLAYSFDQAEDDTSLFENVNFLNK